MEKHGARVFWVVGIVLLRVFLACCQSVSKLVSHGLLLCDCQMLLRCSF